ncbi:MAG: agmatine deiminase family protein [Planctomycetota bacterium]
MTDLSSPEHVSFRWPAEWEPLAAVWVVPPHNEETWPGCLEEAQAEHVAWCDAMSEVVRVKTLDELDIPTNDSWVRDFGPLFVLNQVGQIVIQDFRFNGWGDKYETRDLDDAVPRKLAAALGLPIMTHEQILEGGALETDGRGTLLTTTDCLLSPTRNGDTAKPDVEALLRDTLGITRTIWLSVNLPGDDTDGHIDNAARFINEHTVVVHPAIDPTPLLDAGLNVLTLPGVEPMFYDYPADRFGPAKRQPLPCSYANFLIANGRVFVPTFGQPSDDLALRLLDDAMPNHTPVPIRANHLVVGQGALHCLSMQQPAEPD